MTMRQRMRMRPKNSEPAQAEGNPLWFKDAIIYEVHIRAFFDSDGDGMGDFRGLVAKLDYLQTALKENITLHITCSQLQRKGKHAYYLAV